MIADPFQRLNALTTKNFPNGVNNPIALHVGNPSGEPNPSTADYLRATLDLSKYHPPSTPEIFLSGYLSTRKN